MDRIGQSSESIELEFRSPTRIINGVGSVDRNYRGKLRVHSRSRFRLAPKTSKLPVSLSISVLRQSNRRFRLPAFLVKGLSFVFRGPHKRAGRANSLEGPVYRLCVGRPGRLTFRFFR